MRSSYWLAGGGRGRRLSRTGSKKELDGGENALPYGPEATRNFFLPPGPPLLNSDLQSCRFPKEAQEGRRVAHGGLHCLPQPKRNQMHTHFSSCGGQSRAEIPQDGGPHDTLDL